MDPTVAAGLIGASAAILGAGVAGVTSFAIEGRRSRENAEEAHRAELRRACSDFTAAIARIRSGSYALSSDPAARSVISSGMDEARAGCERLRILVNDSATQHSARMALRHAFAIWKLAETGNDPRAGQYPGKNPHTRLREELTKLYVGVRRELGVKSPEDVFEELDD